MIMTFEQVGFGEINAFKSAGGRAICYRERWELVVGTGLYLNLWLTFDLADCFEFAITQPRLTGRTFYIAEAGIIQLCSPMPCR